MELFFFDNSAIQNLYLSPEDFGKRNNKIIKTFSYKIKKYY